MPINIPQHELCELCEIDPMRHNVYESNADGTGYQDRRLCDGCMSRYVDEFDDAAEFRAYCAHHGYKKPADMTEAEIADQILEHIDGPGMHFFKPSIVQEDYTI